MTPKECFAELPPEMRAEWLAGRRDVYLVWDSRTPNVTGPYTVDAATEMAKSLNEFVYRNGPTARVFAGMRVEVTGPFYSRKIVNEADLASYHEHHMLAADKEQVRKRRRECGTRMRFPAR
jgi:hypothetical protein